MFLVITIPFRFLSLASMVTLSDTNLSIELGVKSALHIHIPLRKEENKNKKKIKNKKNKKTK